MPIYVTSIESLEPASVEPPAEDPAVGEPAAPAVDQPDGGGTTVEASPITGESVLPDTVGFSVVTVSALLAGGCLLVYRFARQG